MVPVEELRRLLAAVDRAARPAPVQSRALSAQPGTRLTQREIDVVQRIADGRSTILIAADLHISQETVKKYIATAARRLGTTDRATTVLAALRAGHIH